jgi:hypothetical protein
MVRLIVGVLFVLAAVAPISASVISSPPVDATLIDPSTSYLDPSQDGDGALLTSIASGYVTMNSGAGEGGVWWQDADDYGPPTDNAILIPTDDQGNNLITNLTVGFSGAPVTEFGLDAIPSDEDQPYNMTVSFFASDDGSGAALATITESILANCCTGENDTEYQNWYFFGYQGSPSAPIGSATISTNDCYGGPGCIATADDFTGMILSEFEYTTTPEPSTSLLLAAGLFGFGLIARRRLAR